MSANRELVKGNAIVLILSCLAREPMHGYRVVKELEALSEGYFNMREGTLYPHLHQLENDEMIEGNWEPGLGERQRKLYRITQKGKTELARRQAEWSKFQANLNLVLSQIPEGV